MGLHVTHGCWNAPYSAFTRWRSEIARAAGYSVARLVKFDDYVAHNLPLIDWGHVTNDQLLGKWESTPSDPILVLIAHSDCDGFIFPEQARPLADRIEELIPRLSYQEDAERARKFVQGLRQAADMGEPVEFG
jgi:hypothetical protein